MYSPPQATWTVKRLIAMQIALGIAILIEAAAMQRSALRQAFELSWASAVGQGYLWQLVTASLVHTHPLQLLFNLLTLWMFGSELEQRWGRQVFLRYYVFCAVSSSLIFLLLGSFLPAMRMDVFSSSTGANLGLLIAYAIYWPERQVWFFFLFPVRMKFVALITGLIALSYAVSAAPFVLSAAGHLGGLIAAGLLLLLTGGEPQRVGRVLSSVGSFLTSRLRRPDSDLGTEFEPGEMEARIDQILDKISREGMKSLTVAEKKFLRAASERMNRRKH
jgi:membrane associated rhomboid family serine protease